MRWIVAVVLVLMACNSPTMPTQPVMTSAGNTTSLSGPAQFTYDCTGKGQCTFKVTVPPEVKSWMWFFNDGATDERSRAELKHRYFASRTYFPFILFLDAQGRIFPEATQCAILVLDGHTPISGTSVPRTALNTCT